MSLLDYRALFDATPTPLLALLPPDWTMVAANEAHLRASGMTREEQVGHKLFDVFPADPDDPEADGVPNLTASLARVMATKAPDAMAVQRYAVRNAHGRFEDRWWSPVNTPVFGPDGEVALVLHQVEEVTDLVRLRGKAAAQDQIARAQAAVIARARSTEADLQQANTLLAAVMESVPGVVYAKDQQGRMLAANRGTAELVGKPVSDILGRTDFEFLDDKAEAASIMATDRRIMAQDRAEFVEETVSGPDGGTLVWFSSKAPFRNAKGAVIGLIGSSIDITERKRLEERLRQLNETLEAEVAIRTAERDRVWRNSREMLGVADMEGRWVSVSPAWTRVLGHPEAAILGRTSEWLEHPDDQAKTRAEIAWLAEGRQTLAFENRFRHADGSYRRLSWTAVLEGGLIFATARDVTDERARQAELEAAQDALRQAQKMEAVGQLTGGIAHDFNNMLAVVIGSLDLLGRRLGDDARARRYADAAADGARRAALLTQRLLAFSRQQPLQPEAIDPNKLVTGMSSLLRGSLGSDIRLETVLAAGGWRTHADPNQLESVILNLAVNARDAMPDGGRLTIETQNADLDLRYAEAHLGVPAGQYVLIAVTDTGTGMPKEVVAKAFDPFFTTKDVGKGTGLGLSQVYGFVKQSGGHVKIYSEPGQGTTVKVYLPRLTGPEQDQVAGQPRAEMPFGDAQEVILVVEDEPGVRAFSVEALNELGYRVLDADGAASALRLLDAHPEIKLLFTDVVMPDMNGRKLADAARQRRPGLRVLFTTGYTRNAVVHNGVLDPGVELIGKPFTIEELAAKVRSVLDR